MQRILLLLLMLIITVPAWGGQRTIVTQRPYYNPAYYGGHYNPYSRRATRQNNLMFSDINDLERYALNKNYYRDNDRTRIERLEMQAFGAVQQGNLMSRYENVRDALLTRPKQNYKTSLLRNIGNYFTGQLTGFTPPIYSQINDYYPTDYGNSSFSSYSSPFGNGYRVNNYGVGSSSGVRILD